MENVKYYILIKENLKIEKVFELSNTLLSDLKYIIHCDFLRVSSSSKNQFYKNQVFDKNNNRIENNVIIINSISCFIKEDENWEVVIAPNHQAVSLSTEITDRLGNKLEKKFYNSQHDTTAFENLIQYLKDLQRFATHDSVMALTYYKEQVVRLDNKIKELERELKLVKE